ncbi:MAG: HEPN domain-containing protein [Gammaproteobacteria bacterium]|nr:HEPN domain-containing protein [Gammaproteobacteria bacterium]
MSDEPRHASNPREWMNRARSNLAIAKNRIPDVYLEDLCFDAQQAAEKAIEAVFVARGIEFPFIHDLTRLLAILEKHGEDIPDAVRRSGALTHYAGNARYPLDVPTAEHEYQDALAIAEATVAWAEARI